MIGWIFVGVMVCAVVSVSVLIFFKGASPQQTVLEQKWENVEKEMLPEYNFKFYGDCGALAHWKRSLNLCSFLAIL